MNDSNSIEANEDFSEDDSLGSDCEGDSNPGIANHLTHEDCLTLNITLISLLRFSYRQLVIMQMIGAL